MFTALSGISSNDLQLSTGTGPQQSTTGSSAPKQVFAPVSQTDTVQLSVTQQVRNLHSEGEGPGQIASSLGLTSSQVNNDLYVSLTWPQLLSKVASSSLNLGAASAGSSVTASSAPDADSTTSAAVVFPASNASEPAAGGTKDTSVPDLVIFPATRDSSAPAGFGDPTAKLVLTAGTSGSGASKDAAAA